MARLQITVSDEGRDMWQVYLGLKEYTAALEACRDLAQRDRVYAAQVLGPLHRVMNYGCNHSYITEGRGYKSFL